MSHLKVEEKKSKCIQSIETIIKDLNSILFKIKTLEKKQESCPTTNDKTTKNMASNIANKLINLATAVVCDSYIETYDVESFDSDEDDQ